MFRKKDEPAPEAAARTWRGMQLTGWMLAEWADTILGDQFGICDAANVAYFVEATRILDGVVLLLGPAVVPAHLHAEGRQRLAERHGVCATCYLVLEWWKAPGAPERFRVCAKCAPELAKALSIVGKRAE